MVGRLVVKLLFILIGLVSVITSSSGEDNLEDVRKILDTALRFNSTKDIKKKVMNAFEKLDLNSILQNVSLDNFSSSSRQCVSEYKNLTGQQFLQYIDAAGKPHSGLFTGNIYWLGSYQECMNMKDSHYCTFGKIYLDILKANVMLGLCVPEACTLDDITELLNKTSVVLSSNGINLFRIQPNYAMQPTDSACYNKDKKTYSNGAITMIVISALIGVLCISGTVTDRVSCYIEFYRVQKGGYELYHNGTEGINSKNEGSMLFRFLLCFSLIKNTKTLFNTDMPPGAITSINGIRTLSIMWVILGHTLLFSLSTTDDVVTVLGWLQRFTMQAIDNATLSVDTFFLLSGLLVSYLSMKRFENKGNLPLLRFYLHRYIRLTPSYAYLMFFLAYLYPILSEGPFWFLQGPDSVQSQSCVSYWWTNLLYINNLYPTQANMCMNWSWYLANDMQFYIISPTILYVMYRFKWIGVIAANGILMLTCLVTNGVLIHVDHAEPLFFDPTYTMLSLNSPTVNYLTKMYMKPWVRLSPYLVGLVLGYILQRYKTFIGGTQRYVYNLFGWLIAVGTGIAVIYGPYSVTDYTWKEPSRIIYDVFFRPAWAIAVGWVVYSCHHGFGGLVNDMMSWKAFVPLSRLTYATYLVHPMVIFLFYYSTQVAIHLTVLNFAFFYVSITFISFALAYIVAMLIEYPVLNLEKLFLKF